MPYVEIVLNWRCRHAMKRVLEGCVCCVCFFLTEGNAKREKNVMTTRTSSNSLRSAIKRCELIKRGPLSTFDREKKGRNSEIHSVFDFCLFESENGMESVTYAPCSGKSPPSILRPCIVRLPHHWSLATKSGTGVLCTSPPSDPLELFYIQQKRKFSCLTLMTNLEAL